MADENDGGDAGADKDHNECGRTNDDEDENRGGPTTLIDVLGSV